MEIFKRTPAQIILLLALLFSIGKNISAQISIGGVPASFQYDLKTTVPFISMPTFNKVELLKEDSLGTSKLKPFRFAKSFAVEYTPDNSGIWDTLSNGDRVWRLGINSSGAYSLNVIFSEYNIPRGATLFIYNETKTIVLGAFTYKNNAPSGILATSPVAGNSIIVEYFVPVQAKSKGKLCIGKIGHDYRGTFSERSLKKDGNFGRADSCNVDINCPAGAHWQTVKNAVCRLLIGGSTLCTGFLINNTGNDGKPYILSANHCFLNTTDPASTIFVFDYESPYCSGPDGMVNRSLSGSQLKATTDSLDFALLEMYDTPSYLYHPYYAGWDAGTTNVLVGTAIHHPEGDVKKISMSTSITNGSYCSTEEPSSSSCLYAANTHWLIKQWETGTTNGGSSGSPLFDQNYHAVGTLTGGEASCTWNYNDYFEKISHSWADYSDSAKQLKHWLDPAGLGVTVLDGYDPFNGKSLSCDTASNISNAGDTTLYEIENGWGYWTGHNSYKITKYADKYKLTSGTSALGAIIHVAHSYNLSGTSYLSFKLWEGANKPTTEIYSKDILLSQFTANEKYTVEFDSVINLPSQFYAGYEISYSSNDTFAVYQAKNRNVDSLNSIYVYFNNFWEPLTEITNSSLSSSLDIGMVNCPDSSINISVPEDSYTKLTIYPNPSLGFFEIGLTDSASNSNDFKFYDLTGKQVSVTLVGQGTNYYTFAFENEPSGIYIVSFKTKNKVIIKKICLIRQR
jgi:lysyl endopeptidase